MEHIMSEYIQEEIHALKDLDYDRINEVYTCITTAYKSGGRVYLVGNGGSSANASHWVNDLKKNIKGVNNGFDVICLTDNVPLLTAYANDVAYEEVFLQQVKGCLRNKDVMIALSVSGSSPNLVRVIRYARQMNCKTISIIADYNGILAQDSDVVLVIKTKSYGIAEDIQQCINHILVQKLKKEFNSEAGEERFC